MVSRTEYLMFKDYQMQGVTRLANQRPYIWYEAESEAMKTIQNMVLLSAEQKAAPKIFSRTQKNIVLKYRNFNNQTQGIYIL